MENANANALFNQQFFYEVWVTNSFYEFLFPRLQQLYHGTMVLVSPIEYFL